MSRTKVARMLAGLLPKSALVPLFFANAVIKRKLEPEMLYLPKVLSHCQVAIDIGANNGLYSYYLARHLDAIKAFEPQPALCDMLRDWNHAKVETFNFGLSDKSGTMTLHVPKDSMEKELAPLASFRKLPNSIEYQVPVRRLDDFNFKDVGFIKIDVEGHEAEVLRGALKTIHDNKPILLVEIEQRHLERPIADSLREIEGLGYAGFFLKAGELVNICEFSFNIHQNPFLRDPGDTRNPLKGYVNNFFFFPQKF